VSWGLFAPEIILPEHAESWDIEKVRNVLIHELSHIQRLDWLTMLIVRFTRAIYWFNMRPASLSRKQNRPVMMLSSSMVVVTINMPVIYWKLPAMPELAI
jgi:hypothetical protein